ncbi:MAG TPA: Flp pilus assembly protein CpaB [Armatimonadota bacterium]|jgi:pilus assembly protein CpaB
MRTMNRRTAILLSLVFGLAVAGIVFVMTRPQPVAGERQRQTVTVVVATQDISPRTTIRPEMVARHTIQADVAPAGAESDFTGVFGKVTMRQIEKGETILATDVASAGPQLGLSYGLKGNWRAQTVAIDPVSGVAGFLKAGDHVDVIATYTAQETNVTRTVLQNVELMAIGSQPSTTSRADERANKAETDAVTATLKVTPQQVDTLALVSAKAKIHLALRSPDDKSITPPSPVTTRAVFGVGDGAVQAPPASPPQAAAPAPAPAYYPSPERPQPAPTPRAATGGKAKAAPADSVVVTRGTDTQEVPVH